MKNSNDSVRPFHVIILIMIMIFLIWYSWDTEENLVEPVKFITKNRVI